MDLEIVNDPEDGIVAVDRDTGDRVPVPMDELDVKSTYSESINTEEQRITEDFSLEKTDFNPFPPVRSRRRGHQV